MKKENKEERLHQFLDGDLNDSEEREMLSMLAEDSELREMFRFERSLNHSFRDEPNPDSFQVPVDFTDSVMNKIQQSSANKGKSIPTKPASIFKLFASPVYAAAAVLLLSLGFGYLFSLQQGVDIGLTENDFTPTTQVVSERESEIWIRFVYFDESAETMEVAGDFSDWDPIPLDKEYIGDSQVWTGLIPVTRGEHRYMFVRDGEDWLTDPLAAVQQDDGFGNQNAVLYL